MRRSIVVIALGFLLPAVAQAATVTVNVGSASSSYTLQSLSVDSGGNVTVTAAAAGTTPTPTPTPTPGGSNCTSTSTLTCVNTALPASAFQRVAYRPDPKQVYAFRIQVPASGRYLSEVAATVQTGSKSAKLIVISETPGDVSTVGKPMSCYGAGNEVSSVYLAVNRSDAHPSLFCQLKPGATYYANLASTDAEGETSCSTTSNCAFYFEGR